MTWRIRSEEIIARMMMIPSSRFYKRYRKILSYATNLLTSHERLRDFQLWFDKVYFIVETIYSLASCLGFLSQRSFSVTVSTMGFSFNSTVLPAHDAWSGYLAEAHKYLPDSTPRIALLALINIPIIVIVLNVLRQLVRLRVHFLGVFPSRLVGFA